MAKTRDEPSTQEKLIEAARLCLLEEGAAGASVKSIAARAGVNHGLIHRHFGSKEALIIAVHDRMQYELPALSGKDLEADAEHLMKSMFHDQQISIELLALSYRMPELRKAMLKRVREVTKGYIANSPFSPGVDALQLGATIMGLAVYHSLSPRLPIRNAVKAMLRSFGDYPNS